jgi:hypothetical protein
MNAIKTLFTPIALNNDSQWDGTIGALVEPSTTFAHSPINYQRYQPLQENIKFRLTTMK